MCIDNAQLTARTSGLSISGVQLHQHVAALLVLWLQNNNK